MFYRTVKWFVKWLNLFTQHLRYLTTASSFSEAPFVLFLQVINLLFYSCVKLISNFDSWEIWCVLIDVVLIQFYFSGWINPFWREIIHPHSCLEKDGKTDKPALFSWCCKCLALEPEDSAESFWEKSGVIYWNILMLLHVLRYKEKTELSCWFSLDVGIMENCHFLQHAFV